MIRNASCPVNRELRVVGLGHGNIDILEQSGKDAKNPLSRRSAAYSRIRLRRVFHSLGYGAFAEVAVERNARFQKENLLTTRGEKSERVFRIAHVIEDAIAMHDIERSAID
jgi:hypothetical protein